MILYNNGIFVSNTIPSCYENTIVKLIIITINKYSKFISSMLYKMKYTFTN